MATDLYGNPINDNDPAPSLGKLQLQGIQLNHELNDPFHDFDLLTTEYPALKDKIQQLRNEGISDENIDYVLKHDIEPHLNFIAKPEWRELDGTRNKKIS